MGRSLIAEAINTPWKFWNQLYRWIVYPYNRYLFMINGIVWKTGWRIYGIPQIMKSRKSHISIGERLDLRSTLHSNPLGVNHRVILCTWSSNAIINIGNDFGMTGGVICAAEEITIFNRVVVGANTSIIDTDFHPIDAKKRIRDSSIGKTAPIVIENDVFIGMNCIILKGVRLGEGCVVGAGSVVTRDVPSGMIAAGNPARIIGHT